MAEAKFTKGPWVARGKTPSRIYGMQRKDKEVIVAATGSVINEAGANAYLIAAAPEMYEMLKKMQAVMYHLSNEQGLIDSKREACRDDFSTINGLLAKARGE